MQTTKHRRVRIAEGVYKDRGGLAATVKAAGQQREKRYPLGTSIRTIQEWRRTERDALLKDAPAAIERGSL